MKLVLGASGRLGKALCAALDERSIVAPPRAVYEDWWRASADISIGAYLDHLDSSIECIFVAAGLIDPRASALEHERVNLQLPRQILRAAAPRHIRVVTFGTMMEVISIDASASAYIASKLALAEDVRTASQDALHVRIHTLYGGAMPTPHMFTGQMVHALITRSPFRMSPGNQLREYHHVDDDAQAIIALGSSEQRGVIHLNHGAPISLAELARHTFEALGAIDLLDIGALPAPDNERLDLDYIRHPLLRGCCFRDVLTAMPEYLRECVAASRLRP